MLSQQIIVDMTDGYPFGSYHNQQLPDNKIFVRRIVDYNSTNYAMYKEKFDIAKKINNPNVIRLIKVLEEEGRFHLLYEYIQFSVESQLQRFSLEHLENLKMKLVYLSAYLFENRLQTEFTIANVGLDRKMELKYYLSVDFKTSNMKLAETQNGYISQINRIHRMFVAQLNSADRKNKFITEPQQRLMYSPKVSPSSKTPYQRTDSITMKQQSLSMTHQNREKSVMSHKTIGKHQAKSSASTINTNTIQMLNHIEMRLGELKITIKKSNTEEHKEMRESVKERWSKNKADNRKYSGEVSYFSPVPKKIQMVESPKSVRNPHKTSFKMGLENIVEASEQQNNRKESTDTAKLQLQAKQQQLNAQLTQPVQRNISTVNSTVQNYTEQHRIKAVGASGISIMAKKGTAVNSINVAMSDKQPSFPSPKSFDTISRSSKMKQPKNKIDFEELKKNQFESFFQSQQKYIHEFLGILGDDSEVVRQRPEPTDIDKIQQSNKAHIHQDDILRSKSRNNNYPHSHRDLQQETSPSKLSIEQKRHREFELKDRITQAIKHSNIALERYRKLSIHSINTEFNKSKKG